MDVYDSEREQLDAIKKWLKDNGLLVVLGLVVGLGSTLGWNGWKAYQSNQAELASEAYQALLLAASTNRREIVEERATYLMGEHPKSGYAPLAALVLAKGAHTTGQEEDAIRHLQWVVANANQDELRQIAQLRIARLAIGRDDFAGAEALLAQIRNTHLAAGVTELRGDIALAQGDEDAARRAYEQVLADANVPPVTRARVQLKLDELGFYNFPPESAS